MPKSGQAVTLSTSDEVDQEMMHGVQLHILTHTIGIIPALSSVDTAAIKPILNSLQPYGTKADSDLVALHAPTGQLALRVVLVRLARAKYPVTSCSEEQVSLVVASLLTDDVLGLLLKGWMTQDSKMFLTRRLPLANAAVEPKRYGPVLKAWWNLLRAKLLAAHELPSRSRGGLELEEQELLKPVFAPLIKVAMELISHKSGK